jgi:hypothetical protein
LDRVGGAHFLGGRISHYERSRPACRGVCNCTRKNLVSNGRRAISTSRNRSLQGVIIIKANDRNTSSVEGGTRFQGSTKEEGGGVVVDDIRGRRDTKVGLGQNDDVGLVTFFVRIQIHIRIQVLSLNVRPK